MTLVLTIKPKRGEFGVRPEAVQAAVAWRDAGQFREIWGRYSGGIVFAIMLIDYEPEHRAMEGNSAALWSMQIAGRA